MSTDQPTPPPAPYGNAPAAPPVAPAGAPGGAPAGTDYPGKTLGLVALIAGIASYVLFPFVGAVVAIITGAIGRKQAKQAGYKNTMATVGLWLGIANIVLSIILTIVIIVIVVAAVNASGIQNPLEICGQYGPGEHVIDGVTYTCG